MSYHFFTLLFDGGSGESVPGDVDDVVVAGHHAHVARLVYVPRVRGVVIALWYIEAMTFDNYLPIDSHTNTLKVSKYVFLNLSSAPNSVDIVPGAMGSLQTMRPSSPRDASLPSSRNIRTAVRQ